MHASEKGFLKMNFAGLSLDADRRKLFKGSKFQ
jgi:hypothetical protein